MKKYFSLAILLFVGMVYAEASHVNEQEARQKAEAFFMTGVGTRSMADRLIRVYLPLMTKSPSWSVTDAPIYVYNKEGGGYVIISGDDRTSSVLGYSEKGRIDGNRLPVNLKSWLQGYVRKIERLEKVTIQSNETRAGSSKTEIRPKLKTAWGQDYPYNLHTPELHVVWNDMERTVNAATGCVATAMAQVMNYYRYPNATLETLESYEGTSDIPVMTEDYAVPDTVKDVEWVTEEIPAGSVIDWDNIVDNYDLMDVDGNVFSIYKNTEAQIEAVSRLIQYCGAATDMQYGLESLTWDGPLLTGLIEVMGYEDVYALYAKEFNAQGWIDAVYQELATAGPVQFGGSCPTMGGHQFVIDGYQSRNGKDYFYVNWGWDGEDNGYMLLDVLEPGWIINDSGKSEGFTEEQCIICGMGPNGKGVTKCPFEGVFLDLFEMGKDGKTYTRRSQADSFDVNDYSISWVNIHKPIVTAVPAIVALDDDNQIVTGTVFADVETGMDMEFFQYWGVDSEQYHKPFPFGDGLGDGTYTVAAVTFEPGTEDWVLMENSENFSVKVTVSGNKATFINSDIQTSVTPVVFKPSIDTGTSWYSLSGVQHDAKPTGKGIYIHNGQKILVK